MKNKICLVLSKKLVMVCVGLCVSFGYGQSTTATPQPKSDFWNRVQFGGGIGLSVGSGFSDITIAPGAIYNFNEYVAAGVGIQGSYVRVKNNYGSYIYGGSIIGLFNPIEQVQVSGEMELLRVNTNFVGTDFEDQFWTPALYVGVGYRTRNVTLGIRYNLLFNENKSIYSEAFMPFVRVYF